MGLRTIKDVLPEYMLSIISTLECDHPFFTKSYVRPVKPKKKPNEDSDMFKNEDNFWTDIPDELKSSKHCRIYSKPRNIEDLPIS